MGLHLHSIVECNNREHTHVYVSTKSTRFALETMVFSCDSSGVVTDWIDLECERYSDDDEAANGHKMIVAKWGKLRSFA